MGQGDRLFREARALIEVESTTGSEGPCLDLAERLLQESGLEVRSIPVAAGRRDLLAGPEGAPVLLCTHLDTVPPYVPFGEDAEHLRGRGSCDAKGIAAAMLEAARRLLAAGERRFGILFLVGEETDHCGAIAADAVVRSKHLVVGEPTKNLLARGHKGAIMLRLEARGVAAHSAYPERGRSAIHRLLDALQGLRRVDLGTHPILGPATVNAGRIGGGVAANVMAPSAWAEVVVRGVLPIEETERRIGYALLGDLDLAPRPERGDDLAVHVVSRMPPTFTEVIEGLPTTVVAYGTDLPFLSRVGKPYLVGPGDILDAHTDGEKVERRQLLEGAALYETIVRRLAG